MTKLDTLKKEIAYLSLGRKLVLFASLFTLLFLIFPWGTYGVQGEGYEFVPESFGAFGIFSIFGWLLLVMVIKSLWLLFREIVGRHKKFYGVANYFWWILLGGVGVYTIVIALFVMNSSYLKGFDSQFSMKIGIFLTLFMQAVVVLGGFLGQKDDQRSYLKESLSRPHQVDTQQVNLQPEPPNTDQMSLGDYDRK